MKNITNLFIVMTITAFISAGVAQAGSCGSHSSESTSLNPHKETKMETTQAANIVETAVSAGSFNTLVAAVKAAGLVPTLASGGHFTVFAPTDAAFAKLPKGTVEELLKPENLDQLQAILTYHVVPGKVLAADVVGSDALSTVQGEQLMVNIEEGKVLINDATVTKADIMASNGVIHVIDTVVLPKM